MLLKMIQFLNVKNNLNIVKYNKAKIYNKYYYFI